MIRTPENELKPFLKWAGGKGQLLKEIKSHLPNNIRQIETYIEPFVGSGAVFFFLKSNYPNIQNWVLNDLNSDLISLYLAVQNNVSELIQDLDNLQSNYDKLDMNERQILFGRIREEFNSSPQSIKKAVQFVFLNKTCFNGLYRVNSKGKFNVPFGKYKTAKICDENKLISAHNALKDVQLFAKDYSDTISLAGKNTFYYIDPPYKPISKTSNFNSYIGQFGDEEQIKLNDFCVEINAKGGQFLLSNSDPKNTDSNNHFFDELYGDSGFSITRVSAVRAINSKADGRGKINEVLVKNYE